MRISVVIPTFNRCSVLTRCLNSVLTQSQAVDEIFVVDNGSTDGTKDLIEGKYPNVRYIFEPVKGVSRARNIGISHATGEWIALLDSDDQWERDKIETLSRAIEQKKKNERLWHSDEIWIRDGKKVNQKAKHKKSGGHIFEKCLNICCISPSSALLHKSLFSDFGNFDEKLKVCEDYDYWLRIASRESIGFVDEKLVIKYGGYGDQLSKKYWGMDRYRIQALRKLAKNSPLTKNQRKLVKEKIISKLAILVKGAESRGNISVINKYKPILIKWSKVSLKDTSIWSN